MIRVGVLGGGQLARMLALAGAPLGIEVGFRDAAHDACAQPVARGFVGHWDDERANRAFLDWADTFTWEFEHVPWPLVERIETTGRLHPQARALEIKRDRAKEKAFFDEVGIPTARWRKVDTSAEIRDVVDQFGGRCVVKSRFHGYDGKGQAVVNDACSSEQAWQMIDGQPAIAEAFVPFAGELSSIVARSADGRCVPFPVTANVHKHGILVESRPMKSARAQDAHALACRLADALDYVGVLALELFETADGELLANEFAPRVHNSGHWTIDACETSQFEQHLRMVCGLPHGEPSWIEPAVMLNLIGGIPERQSVLAVPGAHLHLYGKTVREGRKVGHVTLCAADSEALDRHLAALSPLVEQSRQLVQ
ncbi:MAG: 5-(carboxyamino)imidazole ribonucleotide synthase [Candidatus Dadabacteria bacterium]|nr:MAG: 5-(carboxyamino)imidazole ribonucleotide synthase [Candidatus Dadabacteria bacterium]